MRDRSPMVEQATRDPADTRSHLERINPAPAEAPKDAPQTPPIGERGRVAPTEAARRSEAPKAEPARPEQHKKRGRPKAKK